MSFSPPAAPGPNPYVGPPTPPPGRPGWTRKRVLLPSVAVLFLLGVIIGGADTSQGTTAEARPGPTSTVTATVSATPEPAVTRTVTAAPKPAPTVTKTKTVRVTVAPAADGSGDSGGSGGSDTGGSTYYANCTAVRAAGAAPIRTGDPGYGSHLDRDGDGVACE
ncbi:excalibur calcium-binding domain-containing protein [Streptomyces sp. NBC_01498]|uniref:excalibur calcium-binding domain-containing protein n=1 Tax=Streptomyces sp. NBC_01498 TaxID=2975870 RepID=UPI002E7AB0EF|nr:excalibur calcium-binding domain-containing protein [Streptomyces sp. NBC_01498]WTL28125.1 excalibur calcium-binding domain-containing protein [Streptomyces sp. NBC_01498]